MKISVFLILIMSVLNIFSLSSQKDDDIQSLHNKISKELLSIRKEYPQTQPTVYSLLDQVCKIYHISKDSLEKKRVLKEMVQDKEIENKLLKSENSTLKHEISSLKNEFNSTLKNFSSISKKLEQKNNLINMMAKEKQKIASEKARLEEERKLLLKAEKIENQNNGSGIEQETNIKINDSQSLSLTSTSAPTSPL